MTLNDLKALQTDIRQGFSLRRVRLDDTGDWSIVNGALCHRSGGFFAVTGLRDIEGGSRRVMLYQPQGAFNGLMTRRRGGGAREFLLQARAEPGNVGEIQYGPTVQSTPANYLRMHGGNATAYIDWFLGYRPELRLLGETTQLDLGERYYGKTKRVVLAEVDADIALERSFTWASRDAVLAAAGESYMLNTDLRSAIALSPWSDDPGSGELVPASSGVRRSVASPVREAALAAIAARLGDTARRRMAFVPLDSLPGWTVAADEIREDGGAQGFSVIYVEVTAAHRERAQWIQPLIHSHGTGDVVLACREVDGVAEVLVRVERETGLFGCALLPSWLRYPGAEAEPPAWLRAAPPVWLETEESDEGGRFYRDRSRYRLVRLPADFEPGPGEGHWLRVSELKRCLAQSNLCTIQLRVVASHLLAASD